MCIILKISYFNKVVGALVFNNSDCNITIDASVLFLLV